MALSAVSVDMFFFVGGEAAGEEQNEVSGDEIRRSGGGEASVVKKIDKDVLLSKGPAAIVVSACGGCADVRGASAVPVRGCCSTRQSKCAGGGRRAASWESGWLEGGGLPMRCWAPGDAAGEIRVVTLDNCRGCSRG